jgi:GTP cyclohydrolase I
MLSTTDSEDHDELIAKADPEREDIVQQLSSVYHNLLSSIGEDPMRQGLKKTPERAAKALWYFTHGYHVKLSGNLFVFSKLFTLLLSNK